LADLRPRRVLMTGDTVGGVWTFTLDLAEGLIARGVEVCLATFGGHGNAAQRAQAASIEGLQWLESDLKLEWMEEPWADIQQAGQLLLRVENEFRPDAVHLNTLCHGTLNWRAPVVTTVHSCVISWWDAVKEEALPATWNRYYAEVDRSLRCAAMITAPSSYMTGSVVSRYGVNPANTRTIPNGRKDAGFHSQRKESMILSAGRLWDEAKNIEALVKVAPKLEWPVFLAGEQNAAYLGECRALGSLSTIDLANWYARAAIYASPARYEPFGLSILEAALSGCVLVLGDIPSLREIWHEAAVFVTPDNQQQLEAAMRALIKNPERRQRLSELALKRARNFSQATMVSRYLVAYADVRKRHQQRSEICAS
jgi:glycogen synthase